MYRRIQPFADLSLRCVFDPTASTPEPSLVSKKRRILAAFGRSETGVPRSRETVVIPPTSREAIRRHVLALLVALVGGIITGAYLVGGVL